MTASEYTRERFVDTFRLAFKPSLAAERQKALAEGSSEFLEHCLRVAEKASVVKEQELRLAGMEQDLLDEAVSRCLEYLPLEQVEKLDDVAFVIFQSHGARGYSPVVHRRPDRPTGVSWRTGDGGTLRSYAVSP